MRASSNGVSPSSLKENSMPGGMQKKPGKPRGKAGKITKKRPGKY